MNNNIWSLVSVDINEELEKRSCSKRNLLLSVTGRYYKTPNYCRVYVLTILCNF